MAEVAENRATRRTNEEAHASDIPFEIAEYQAIDLSANSEAVAWLEVRPKPRTPTSGPGSC